MLDVADAADNLASVTTLVDLTKAFEQVRLQDVWKADVRFGFPAAVLRLMLANFRFRPLPVVSKGGV